MAEWVGNNCPERGVGLSHVPRTYPTVDGKCSHCNVLLSHLPPTGVPATATQARTDYATIFDHAYVFTVSGKCGHAGCSATKDEHAVFVTVPDGGCIVDHRSVEPWTQCPICFDYVEPHMRTKPSIETMVSTDEDRARLDRLKEAVEKGYYQP